MTECHSDANTHWVKYIFLKPVDALPNIISYSTSSMSTRNNELNKRTLLSATTCSTYKKSKVFWSNSWSFPSLLNLLGWHWLIGSYRFQVYSTEQKCEFKVSFWYHSSQAIHVKWARLLGINLTRYLSSSP